MEVFDLSQDLLEISGLINVDTAFLCVQDELGRVYCLSTEDFSISKYFDFAWPGDYEAIVGKANGVWIADSRGILFDLLLNENRDELIVNNIVQIPDNKKEIEGIWYDNGSNEIFLLSRKSMLSGKSLDNRFIWIYNYKEQVLRHHINIPILEIWKRLFDFSNVNSLRFSVDMNLPFSDLTKDVHANQWLILCSKPSALIILNENGVLLDVIELDNIILPQPEALCFDMEGSLIIASEGRNSPARIVRFRKSQ